MMRANIRLSEKELMFFRHSTVLVTLLSLVFGLGWVIAPAGARLIWIMVNQAMFLGLSVFSIIFFVALRAQIDRSAAWRLLLWVPLWAGIGLFNLAFADARHTAWLL
ncbi:hypothetical protein [Asaia krungthepensis]|uniref:hypothetical protein n=1 Tax=Asaia krungthepensis TaxID=220990 RepID=UPI00222FB2CB|nr:hypothetical protein [Asaia krungthepensis]